MKKLLVSALVAVVVGIIGVAVAGWWVLGRSTDIEHGSTHGPVTVIKDGHVACYLVDTGAGIFALVDTCNDPSGAAILEVLEERGADTDDVTTIFLTHGHPDHLAAARVFGRAQIFAHPEEVARIEGDETYEGTATQYSDGPTATVNGRVTHEQTIGVGNKRFESFHVPGHTPGSVILLVDGVLMLGDVGVARSASEVAPPPEFFSDDPGEAAASLAKVADMLEGRKVDVVLPAHSGPLEPRALKDYASSFDATE